MNVKSLIVALAAVCICMSSLAQTFTSNLATEKKPWTQEPVFGTGNYKFVVLPDKKGGEENGVFETAIDEINRISPDFVITVGDLIEGFVSDVKYAVPMWDDIIERLGRLDAPFFFVGGNHDLTNQTMTDEFVRRFGTSYYSFSVGPDLFLALDSEEHHGRNVSPEQVEYFRKVLDGWSGRHIYVFMHSPLWYPKNHGGYEEIDAMLHGHQYTVFSGHTHMYYYEVRGGMEYYVLATAGGESGMRGPEVGEVDHYMLVTAREGKPAIANIPVGTMLPNDLVNPKTAARVEMMLSGRYLKVPYLNFDEAAPAEFTFDLTACNPLEQDMLFKMDIPSVKGMEFIPSHLETVLAGGETRLIEVKAVNRCGVEPGLIPVSRICGYEFNGKMKEVAGESSVLTDHVRRLAPGQKMTIECREPYDVNESWDWSGVDDGWFEFDVTRKKKDIEVAVRTHDDIQATDKIFVIFKSGGRNLEYSFIPSDDGKVCIPSKYVKDGEFLLNVGFVDNDDPQEGDPSVLWWRVSGREGRFILE